MQTTSVNGSGPFDLSYFEGKRVLVTGAAGSVGASLCQRLAGIRGISLGLLDHFDHGLLRLADELAAATPSETEIILCSVRDQAALARNFERFAPDIVIHAAALKHVHLGELVPSECVLTNLIGTRNVLAAAHRAGAGQFLLISSDKAAAPQCVMGAAKRLSELYLHGFVLEHATSMRVAAVRFGNVLGSQGSVAPRFAEQIELGGPVTLTHPEMERYFLNMDEAVDLILSVAAQGRPGAAAATYVKDMGQPVSILRLAEEMIARANQDVAIIVTGLRPGEKLSERLFDAFEDVYESGLAGVYATTPRNPGAHVSSHDINELETLACASDEKVLRDRLFACLEERLGPAEIATAVAKRGHSVS